MKVLKKSVSGAILAIGVLFAASFSANAVIIRHDVFNFEAVIDTDFIEAGLEFFALDADDAGFPPADTWSYQLLADAFDPFSSFIDIFDAAGDVVFFDSISLGQAQLSDLPKPVSAPATLAIFTLAMAALYGRRKTIS